MPRHRRRRQLTDDEVAAFERAVTAFHAGLTKGLIALSPASPQYRALARLHAALLAAMVEVTGREAAWCVVGPGRMPGEVK